MDGNKVIYCILVNFCNSFYIRAVKRQGILIMLNQLYSVWQKHGTWLSKFINHVDCCSAKKSIFTLTQLLYYPKIIKISAMRGKSPLEVVKYWFHTFFHTFFNIFFQHIIYILSMENSVYGNLSLYLNNSHLIFYTNIKQ